MQLYRFGMVLLIIVLVISVTGQDFDYESAAAGNPLIPGYFADPSIVRMNKKFYIYATTVSKYMEPVVWVSEDLKHWEVHHLGITGEHRFWAPSVLKGRDGRYYLYYSSGFDFKCHLYIGESPLGPFKKYGKVEDGFDLQIFQDPVTGKVYGISSNPESRPRLVEFNSDPESADYLKNVIRVIGEPQGSFFDYTEGSMLLYRNGWYYLMYSGGKCGDVTYRIHYAKSRNIEGPYINAPDNPILKWMPEKDVFGPGHHSVLQLDDEYFICYHRQDKWAAPTCSERQVCVDKLEFDEQGWIKPVIPTHRGVDFTAYVDEKEHALRNLAFQKMVTSSGNLVHHEPADAVDENFATFWQAGGSGHLSVDLENVYSIQKVQPFWGHYDYFILYKIEYSTDNRTWKVLVDRSVKAQLAAASVQHERIDARYIRVNVIRGGGAAATLYELKVWGN
ncbi:MAG: family 43 glycosylhydrolase [candidate division KSB1 bacterium]|nr:family 43 glycosylhydrolase [candidate division KSB1 bacterium]